MSEWIGELFCKGVTRKAIFWKNVRNKVRLLFGIFQFEFGTPKSASRTEEGTQGEYVCKALAVTLLTLLSCNVVVGSIVLSVMISLCFSTKPKFAINIISMHQRTATKH